MKEEYFKFIHGDDPEFPYNPKSFSGSVARWTTDIANLEKDDGRICRKGNTAARGALGVGAEWENCPLKKERMDKFTKAVLEPDVIDYMRQNGEDINGAIAFEASINLTKEASHKFSKLLNWMKEESICDNPSTN